MKAILMIVPALFLFGCATGGSHPPISDLTDSVAGDASRVAVCAGLTSVDPAGYSGWDGKCPGCDIDAKGLYALAANAGMTAHLMLNSAVTWDRWRETVRNATEGLESGSLLLLALSGHGGQISDDNGDEKDGLDETVCFYDQAIRDDEILRFLGTLPDGLRVVLISDQCHSEGNFRSAVRVVQRAVSFGRWGRLQARPLRGAKPFNGQLIQFAGCREASYSYGAADGGTWTQCLLTAADPTLTWVEWYELAEAGMPRTQVPVMVEHEATDAFKAAPMLR